MRIEKSIAHPKALKLLTDDFFWDQSDEFAPFGSDEAHNILSQFTHWKAFNPHAPYQDFVVARSLQMSLTPLHLSQSVDELSPQEFQTFCEDLDSEIIAIGLVQLVTEGNIEAQLKSWTTCAVQRKLHPQTIEYWDLEGWDKQAWITMMQTTLKVLQQL
ncbi:MAG TPA: hypothetical protein DCS93_02735 [Microscillaceae bacterium]|nr:hypothetical protein [Microscillaceae bacterium]